MSCIKEWYEYENYYVGQTAELLYEALKCGLPVYNLPDLYEEHKRERLKYEQLLKEHGEEKINTPQ